MNRGKKIKSKILRRWSLIVEYGKHFCLPKQQGRIISSVHKAPPDSDGQSASGPPLFLSCIHTHADRGSQASSAGACLSLHLSLLTTWKLQWISSITNVLRVCIMKRCWILSNTFSECIERILWLWTFILWCTFINIHMWSHLWILKRFPLHHSE